MSHPSLDLFLGDPRNIADDVLFPGVDRMREEEPVYFSPSQQLWFITRHEDVVNAFNDPRWSARRLQGSQFLTIPQAEREQLIPNLLRFVPHWVNNIDTPQHDRVRRQLLKGFTRKSIETLRPAIEKCCDELVDFALEAREFDFVDKIAFPLPATVIMLLLGVPLEHIGKMRGWANIITAALAGVQPPRELLLAAEQAFVEMNAIFMAEIEQRKTHPGHDVIGALTQALTGHDALTLEEVLGQLQLIIIAGHDSTANSIGLGLLAMLQHRQQMADYKNRKVDGMTSMTELLRHINVSALQPRVAGERIELRGKTIEAGQYAFLMIVGANRDPRIFDRPTVMDFSRTHLDRFAVFGPGIHHCVGHHLARIELDCLYRRIVDRVPNIEADTSQLRFQPNPVFRGLEALPVRFAA